MCISTLKMYIASLKMYIFSLKMQVIPCIANFLQGIHSFKSRITPDIARDLVNKTKFP